MATYSDWTAYQKAKKQAAQPKITPQDRSELQKLVEQNRATPATPDVYTVTLPKDPQEVQDKFLEALEVAFYADVAAKSMWRTMLRSSMKTTKWEDTSPNMRRCLVQLIDYTMCALMGRIKLADVKKDGA